MPVKKRTTIADVARVADVSMMTVSRAMSGKSGVSKELRQKILEIAEQLNYHPNRVARGLATRQMTTVGLVVPSISNPFYSQIAQGVENLAYEKGYTVILINTNADLDREEDALEALWEQDIGGAILCSLRLPPERLISKIEQLPAVVLINRELDSALPHVVTINVNDQLGAQNAVRHFINQGRKRIAYIGAPTDSFSSHCRLEGYCLALKNAQVDFDPSLVVHIMPTIETGKEAAELLLASHPSIDAILAFNDTVAIGVLQACEAAGKKVPEDIAVIGADDIPYAGLIRPKLTTSRVNLVCLGRLSMQNLLEVFEGDVSSSSYLIEPELVLRESG